MHPAVSIVVPAYNPGPYLMSALRSLKSQTFGDWECVVVDDGSTEDLSWVADFDPRVQLIRQSNEGVSTARNVGIAATSAPWVAFLDADDVWYPAKLERQLAATTDSDIVMVHSMFESIDAGGEFDDVGYDFPSDSYHDFLRRNPVFMSAAFCKRTALQQTGGFDPQYQSAADYELWLRLSEKGRIVRVDEVLAGYRRHDDNMSSNYIRMLHEVRSILRTHLALAQKRHDREAQTAVKDGLQFFGTWLAGDAVLHSRQALRDRDWGEFSTHSRLALRLAPYRYARCLLVSAVWNVSVRYASITGKAGEPAAFGLRSRRQPRPASSRRRSDAAVYVRE